jgi:hypothetical protein
MVFEVTNEDQRSHRPARRAGVRNPILSGLQ